jgi:hypothetical protein
MQASFLNGKIIAERPFHLIMAGAVRGRSPLPPCRPVIQCRFAKMAKYRFLLDIGGARRYHKVKSFRHNV